jgi:hypothetical protein
MRASGARCRAAALPPPRNGTTPLQREVIGTHALVFWTGMWAAWRGFGLGVAVLCVLSRAYQIKRLCGTGTS